MALTVVDTDVLIDALRGRAGAADAVRGLLHAGVAATTAVTRFELCSGAASAETRGAVDALLAPMPVLPLDREAADAAAAIRLQLEADGRGIGMADYLIAGICLARSTALLTRNTRHFERVPELVLAALPGG